ncbi:TonB-dependent receptor [Paraglaciecola sp.]|uniref:TonB-dependent receptor n=2 Tax=Paraglaciecola sp. TaxID=1920173 RepID=UPI0032663EEF
MSLWLKTNTNKHKKFALSATAASIITAMAGGAFSANAQEVGSDADEAELIVVRGVRGALEKSVALKREAVGILDAVSAEDLGKLPDSDVGESLGRIPGVSVGRAFGQGASVSIRGTDPQMTYTTLNGQSVSSTGWYDQEAIDRSFNYSMLPSELISEMEVYKTARADLPEGGIGGTVIVKTRKPLSLDANSLYLGTKYSVGTVSDDGTEFSGLYSWKNEDNNFGVLVAAAVTQGDYVRRGTEADTRWSSDVSPTTFIQERDRKAFDLSAQYRPTDALEIGFHLLSMELVGDNSNTSHYIFHEDNCSSRNDVTSNYNPNGVCVYSETTADNATDSFVQTWARAASMTSDSVTFDLSHTGDNFEVDVVVGKTKADGGTDLTTNYSYGSWTEGANLPTWTGTVDATGNQIKLTPTSDQTVTLDHFPDEISPSGSWATFKGPNSDQESYAQADFEYFLDNGVISSFKGGIRSTSHELEKTSYASVWADSDDIVTISTSELYNGTLEMGANGWSHPMPNISAMVSNTLDNVASWVEGRANYGLIKEDNFAVYGMLVFEGDNYSGDVGVRYINTDSSATGYSLDGTELSDGDISANQGWGYSLNTVESSYDDFLPSFNLKYELDDNVVVRVSAAQAITRANYDNMFLAAMNGYQDTTQGNEEVTFGDPGLLPQKSSQADVAFEYYYGEGNLVSVGLFTKSISNFITTDTKVSQSIGVVSPDIDADSWTVNQYVNAGSGKINGAEFQVQHAFENGFGAVVNYTYADASAPKSSFTDELPVFTLSSKHTANVVAYWENDNFSARAAYNYRSKYMVRETGWYGNRMHDDYGTLDASFGWNPNDAFKVTLEIVNILEEDDIQYGAADKDTDVKDALKEGFPAWSFIGERTMKVGLSYKF